MYKKWFLKSKLLKQFLALTFVVSLLFVSCGKYEDGPLFSIASKKSRVVNKWEIEKVLKNNNEIKLTDTLLLNYREYKKNGDVVFVNHSQLATTGKWELKDKNEYLLSKIETDTVTYIENAKILKLKQNQLWLKVDQGGVSWEYHFKTSD